jgi:ABC-type phosphate/phosphonate transport system ATPase subunit
VICSLHFLSLARRYGTRVIALKGGKVRFDGKPAAIDEAKFREIYGDDAVEVEIGLGEPQGMTAAAAATRALADDADIGDPRR